MLIETNCRQADLLDVTSPEGIYVRIGRQTAYGTDENDTPAMVFIYIKENKGKETKDGFVDWLLSDHFGPNLFTIRDHHGTIIERERKSLESFFEGLANRKPTI